MHCRRHSPLFTLVALVATGRQTINPTPGPGTKRPAATLTPIRVPQQRLGHGTAGLLAECGRTAFFRCTDGTVVAQKRLAVTTGNPTFLSGARLIRRRRERHGEPQEKRHTQQWHPATARQNAHDETPTKVWPDDIKLSIPAPTTTQQPERMLACRYRGWSQCPRSRV